jgi:hypothetical protein
MSFARGEAMGRRHVDGAGTVTTKARWRQRIAEDPDFRVREKARRRAYYDANKEELRARRQFEYLQRSYGLTRADYEALLAAQGGVCPLCGKRSTKTLCVDHCHETGTIRGLLCRQCNFALGCFTDSQAAMMAAIAYLGGGQGDRAGAAAQRALAARAVLPPERAGMTVRVEARSLRRRDADPAPAGDRAMRPMWNALDAQLRREGDDGEGGKASILQLIARKLAAKALAGDLEAIKEIFDRMADLITEGREFRGICALSFATVVTTPRANGPSTVEGIVCARLRLSLAGAMDLRNTLDKILTKSMPAKLDALSETGFPLPLYCLHSQ